MTPSSSLASMYRLGSLTCIVRAQELCGSRGGCPGFSPALIFVMVSVDVKHIECALQCCTW